MKGKDGFLYGIPYNARRVVKFNPVDKSMKLIGPVIENIQKWNCGVLAKNRCIYCPLFTSRIKRMLKINTFSDAVETIDLQLQLQLSTDGFWLSGAVARDDCLYYLPWSDDTKDILRVDRDTDTLSLISLPNHHTGGFRGAVLGKDDCIYDLSRYSLDWDAMAYFPMELENISYFDKYAGSYAICTTDDALGCGNIKA